MIIINTIFKKFQGGLFICLIITLILYPIEVWGTRKKNYGNIWYLLGHLL